MFSIIIPTFNNLEYLKLCIESIKKNSKYKNHEIIPHVNDGSDGTLNYLKLNNTKYTHTQTNSGICEGMNMAAKESIYYIFYMLMMIFIFVLTGMKFLKKKLIK